MEDEQKPPAPKACPYCGVKCSGHVLASGAKQSPDDELKVHVGTEHVLLGVAE